MKRMMLVTLAILVACLAMGCIGDLSLGPDTRELPAPDITGSWVVSISHAYPWRLQADSAAGACNVDDFRVTLVSAGSVGKPLGEHFLYSGSHSEIKMVCAGVSRSATEVFGLRDTLVFVAGGNVTADMSPKTCGGFWPNVGLDCPTIRRWRISLTASGFSLFARAGNRVLYNGGFNWRDGLDSIRVQGPWSAHR